MKKLLIFVFLFTLTVFSQQNGMGVGGGVIISDSIWCGGTVAGDSVNQHLLQHYYTSLKITLQGNANSSVDSIQIRAGVRRYSEVTKTVVDTIWGDYYEPVLDSAGTVKQVLINNTVGKSYGLNNPLIDILEIRFLNYWGTATTRKTEYVIQGFRSFVGI